MYRCMSMYSTFHRDTQYVRIHLNDLMSDNVYFSPIFLSIKSNAQRTPKNGQKQKTFARLGVVHKCRIVLNHGTLSEEFVLTILNAEETGLISFEKHTNKQKKLNVTGQTKRCLQID